MRICPFPGSSGLGAAIEFSRRLLHFTTFDGIIRQKKCSLITAAGQQGAKAKLRPRFVSLLMLQGAAETRVLKQQPEQSQIMSNGQHRHH